MLFITSWYKLPGISLYVSATPQLQKILILTGVPLKNKIDCFLNQLLGCSKANFYFEWHTKRT